MSIVYLELWGLAALPDPTHRPPATMVIALSLLYKYFPQDHLRVATTPIERFVSACGQTALETCAVLFELNWAVILGMTAVVLGIALKTPEAYKTDEQLMALVQKTANVVVPAFTLVQYMVPAVVVYRVTTRARSGTLKLFTLQSQAKK